VIAALRMPRDRRWYRLSVGALVVSAWAALAVWGASPFAGYLSHARIGEDGTSPTLALIMFSFGWTLMIVAMMLPSSLPLVNLFHRLVITRPDRVRLLLLLGVGYLAVWTVFGLAAYAADIGIHEAVRLSEPFRDAAGAIWGATLLLAGVYQFTPLKTMCLEKCRSPYSFLVEHWSGRQPSRDALRLGIRHGLFCLGCCWTLMLVMFAVGAGSLGWMLALGALMGLERTTPAGRRLTRPLGAALVAAAVANLVTL
jgi:predicted metal-binding membrane protein